MMCGSVYNISVFECIVCVYERCVHLCECMIYVHVGVLLCVNMGMCVP